MQQDISGAQEGDSKNREEQENRARDEFKKTLLSRTVSAGSVLVGTGAGEWLCAATYPAIGAFLIGYRACPFK